MYTHISRSTNHEALRAELHREELFHEAAMARLARTASSQGVAQASLMSRIRSALGAVGQPARVDCPECACG
jgi:hypothetical protein